MKYQNIIIAIFLILFISASAYTQDSKIFWVDQSLDKVQSASLNGTHVTDVVTGLNNPECIAIDTSISPMKLYCTDAGNSRIIRFNFDGSNLEEIVTGINGFEDLELDLINRKVYWLTDLYSEDKVQRADMDGLNSNIEDIYTNTYAMHGFYGIGVDPAHNWVFWTQYVYGGNDRINRINYDGTGRTSIGNYVSPRDLELVGNTIYFIWGTEDLIMRANLDGSEVDTVLTSVNGHFFAIDTALGMIYWTESAKVKCANLDNSDHSDVISGLSNSLRGIAVYYNPLSKLVKPKNEIPDGFYLAQNYPNPFNPVTTIRFDVPKSVNVQLIVYDLLGRKVATLVNKKMPAGRYEVKWNSRDYPSGLYFYWLAAGKFNEVKKMLLVN